MASFSRQSILQWIRKVGNYLNFRSSLYGQVVALITIMSIMLCVSFGLIFRSVYEQYMNTVLRESGSNIGSLAEGALYYSMIENDKRSLQNTLDIINTLPGITSINMYDSEDNLAYSSFSPEYESQGHIDPNCKKCHNNLNELFPRNEKSFRVIDLDNQCKMSHNPYDQRHLIIRSPIMNERSCYTASCHAHKESDKVLGSLIIKLPLGELDESISDSTRDFYIFALITTLLLATFLILYTRWMIKDPLNALVHVSRSVASGDLSQRIGGKRGRVKDMVVVSNAFNDMLNNLQKANEELQNWSHQMEYKVQKKTEELGAIQREIIRIERLASLGKLSSSVAHEINNPLSGILVYSKLVYKQLDLSELDIPNKENLLKHLKMIETEAKRCGEIVKGLLDFSKKDQENFEPINVHKVLKDTYDLMAHPIKIADHEFRMEFSANKDLIYCNPNQIKQACVALLVNASEALGSEGEIIFRTSNPDKETIMIQIIDNGVGIPDADLSHIFEPFYSTKMESSGIGLGLSIVHGIVNNHKGRIMIDSEIGKGTTIKIMLPLITS